jgi:hypothetical protein
MRGDGEDGDQYRENFLANTMELKRRGNLLMHYKFSVLEKAYFFFIYDRITGIVF